VRLALALPLCILFVTAAAADEGVNLKWSLKVGDSFYVVSTQKTDVNTKVMGQTTRQKMSTTTVTKFEVKTRSDGGYEVKATFLEWKAEGSVLPPSIADRFDGAGITEVLDKKLKVTKLQGYDKFLDQIGGNNDTQRKLFSIIMPEAALQTLFDQVFVTGSKESAAIGDTWDRTDKVPMPGLGNLTSKTKFTLDSTKDGIATITTKADVKFTTGEGNDKLPFKVKPPTKDWRVRLTRVTASLSAANVR
jgi:hypothetical protein